MKGSVSASFYHSKAFAIQKRKHNVLSSFWSSYKTWKTKLNTIIYLRYTKTQTIVVLFLFDTHITSLNLHFNFLHYV